MLVNKIYLLKNIYLLIVFEPYDTSHGFKSINIW